MKTCLGSGIKAPQFLTTALVGGEWSASGPGRFAPRRRAPGTHWTRGWMGPGAGVDAVEKRQIYFPCRESNPTIQPVAIPTELSRLIRNKIRTKY
jgi:hypothetical protein